MPEIGVMLREARMRARIDISEIEASTKIRAKYLRALENEEWALLPGPAYVKSFLRTYAEQLGLDAKMIVEEYKLRHERSSDVELQPMRPAAARDRRTTRQRSLPSMPGWMVVGGVLVGLLVLLGILGSSGGNHSSSIPNNRIIARTTTAPASSSSAAAVPHTRSGRVALQIVPTAPVWVCLVSPHGKRFVGGVVLAPGAKQPVYRGSKFLVTLGNGSVKLRINGRLLGVPQVNNAIGYEVSPAGRRVLATAKRPTCA